MPFVDSREMLVRARAGRYAVGAFNVENMEMAQAVVMAAEKMRAPVMIQTTPGTLKYADAMFFAGMISRLAAAATVPIALHLDHGDSFDLARYCIGQGYTSVMIDGSKLPFEENVRLSRSVVEMAGDVPVEAELGTVGGKEDTHEASASYTDPDQAAEFVRRTGISSFAPAIGTAHGVYKSEPKVDVQLLEKIASLVSIPLVLHGTSGVPDETVRACVERGISKVNYATDLRIAFTGGARAGMEANPKAYDPKKYLGSARDAVMNRVCELICVCASEGKA